VSADGRSPRLPPTRAALVHDWFSGMFGSERVVETLRTGLFDPTAPPDVFTFHANHDRIPPELSGAIVRESRLAALPGLRSRGESGGRWRYLLPYMPLYFRRLDLSAYDLVIASSHACALNVRPRPDALFVVYSHTPIRYVWMPDVDRHRIGGVRGAGLRLFTGYLRRLDREAAQRPDAFVANSTAVRERIERFYGREATVIHPPVDVDRFDPTGEKDPGHFLWVHRLISYKRPEVVAEAFRGLPYRLTMVGTGPLERKLRASLPPNVELRGWLEREELEALYARCSGFIHVGEEDFGITMVEALAAGMPVIGLGRGGARDIVRPGVDGELIEEAEVGPLRAAIERVAQRSWDPAALAARAREFSRERFLERMSALIRQLLQGA
jgi:glycosyltransferase involved in cell wall biosynthesis